MSSSLVRRVFTLTLAIFIVSRVTSGFSIQRKDTTDQIATDQTSQESVQLQVKDVPKRPNDINDSNSELTSKAVSEGTISDRKISSNDQEVATNNNDKKPISIELITTQETEDKSTIITSEPSQMTQFDTNLFNKENINKTTTENVYSKNDEMLKSYETSTNLLTGKDSTSFESKTEANTSEMTKSEAVSETTSELTTIEKIIFRNSKTPEIAVTNKVSEIDNVFTTDLSTSKSDDEVTTVITTPSWKKYVTIDRKRTSSEEITTDIVEKEQKPSEILQTITNAPIRLQPNTDNISMDSNLQVTTNVNMGKENTESSSESYYTKSRNITTVDTKRAGFLDYSKSSLSESTTTTDENIEMTEPQVMDNNTMTTSKVKVSESQSQLTDDALNEEMLKEEMIINHKENSIRHHKVTLVDDKKQNLLEVAPVTKEETVQLFSTEDSLSVQPINPDRRTTLYTISPNYKPMKKIDVQPPKPFVRDPDDNSWRNESISSLGIVFKPKNATKSFKEVLKNKTETEFYNVPENKDNKNELPDLRVRLEKIAEVRKSKKKIYKSGEVLYTDYEEHNSGEASTTTTSTTTTPEKLDEIFDLLNSKSSSTSPETTTPMPGRKWETTTNKMAEDLFRKFNVDTLTTIKPKKYFNAGDYYESTDDYDSDYDALSKIDLKKFPSPYKTSVPPRTDPTMHRYTTKPMSRQRLPEFPERKPTVEYFPPRTTQKVNIGHYDDDFQKKVNYYTIKQKEFASLTDLTDPVATDNPTTRVPQFRYTAYPSERTTKNVYITTPSRLSSPHGFVLNEENFNRGSYVIKHYKDFLNEAAKSSEFDKIPDFLYPDSPDKVNGLSTSPPFDIPPRKSTDNEYNDETEFRKDVLHRFVENFNQNSERFKIDFPILYNNSIIHQKFDDIGRVASSNAFIKRLYGNEVGTKQSPFRSSGKNCGPSEPNCDMNVELSPDYELHYFIPEEEEKQPAVDVITTPPLFNFKL